MYLEKVDENGSIERWRGMHLKIAKENEFKFIHDNIVRSGKKLSELAKYKSVDVVKLFLEDKEYCAFKAEDLIGYDIKPFQNLFRRCVKYEELTFTDMLAARKTSDKFEYFFKNLIKEEELVELFTMEVFWEKFTDAMKRVVYMSCSGSTMINLIREVKPEDWTTRYGRESKEERIIFDRNNKLMLAFNKIGDVKIISARYWEPLLPFYNKIATIYTNRVDRGSRYMSDIEDMIDFYRNCERNIYSKTHTFIPGHKTIFPYLNTDSWSSIRLLGNYDTDTVYEYKRCITKWDDNEKAMQGLEDLKYFGTRRRYSGNRKGVGMHRSYSHRLKLWQPI